LADDRAVPRAVAVAAFFQVTHAGLRRVLSARGALELQFLSSIRHHPFKQLVCMIMTCAPHPHDGIQERDCCIQSLQAQEVSKQPQEIVGRYSITALNLGAATASEIPTAPIVVNPLFSLITRQEASDESLSAKGACQYSTSPRNENRHNENHLGICLSFSPKNRN
jgi:hypothetical protein